MKVMNDYKCECGKVQERFLDSSTKEVDCECGKKAVKMLDMSSVQFRVDGMPAGINGDAWARTREKNFIRNKEQNG